MSRNRRTFLKKSLVLSMAGLGGAMIGKNRMEAVSEKLNLLALPFSLPNLPYSYEDLEPYIDAVTMGIHHTKHHKGYVDKLNNSEAPELKGELNLVQRCQLVNANTAPLIRNNLGGHYNHSLFWQLLKPNPQGLINMPSAKLLETINSTFGSFENFKKEFSEKAVKIFGSGWCWLILDENKKLKIVTTANQDNPLMAIAAEKGNPIMALDVWEHAYYLKYQNKRVDYINNCWNIFNWKESEILFYDHIK